MFYLNYVGCKAVIAPKAIFAVLGFTLTMWDVKFFTYVAIVSAVFRFTLTMWDVKFST